MYRLLKNVFGTSRKNTLCDIDLEIHINDICVVDNGDVFFSCGLENAIGLINNKGEVKYPIVGSSHNKGFKNGDQHIAVLDNPSVIIYSKFSNDLVIVEQGGKNIRRMALNSYYVSSEFGQVLLTDTAKYFSKIPGIDSTNAFGDIDEKGVIYWGNSLLNRCFVLRDSRFTPFVGNGHAGYSVASQKEQSLFNRPNGIACSKDGIYICDSGNNFLRKIKNDVIQVVTQESCLGKIRVKKGMVCFQTREGVKSLFVGDHAGNLIHKSENVVSIDLDCDKNLYILERK